MAQTTAHSSSSKATRSDNSRSRSQVQDFLDRMARALTRGDAHTVATMWDVPALVLDDQAVRAVTSLAEVEQFFSGAKDQYNQRGITDTRAEIEWLEWATDKVAIVEVRWPYLDARGNEVGEETSTYTLRRDERGDLKLRVTVMHGAKTGGQPVRAAS
jgi:hypothetical protein